MSKIRTAVGLTMFLSSATLSLIGCGKAMVEMKNDIGEIIDDMYKDDLRTRPHVRQTVDAAYRTKNFIGRHKVAIAVASTATVTLWIHKGVTNQYNEFLEEKGLLEEYFNPMSEAALIVLA